MRMLEILEATHASRMSRPPLYSATSRRLMMRKIQQLTKRFGGTIPFSALGLDRNDDLIYRQLPAIFGEAEWSENQKTMETVPISALMVQSQNGVGSKNLLNVLAHLDEAPLPELVKFSDDTFWVMEGHHRIALAILSGRTSIDATVEINATIMDGVASLLDHS